MPSVVADTGPLHYLVLIGAADCLGRLFETVLVPRIVREELSHARTPPSVRAWMARPPLWLRIIPSPQPETLPLPELGAGERAAIALALSLPDSLLLMDDRRGSVAAIARGVATTGTLGLLDRAARHRLVDLDASLTRLQATNFRHRPELLEALLARHGKRSGGP